MRVGPLRAEEPPHHRIVSMRELDDHLAAELVQPADDLAQRDVSRDRQVMDEREAERKLRARTVEERLPLHVVPADRARWIREVHGERPEPPLPLPLQSRIQVLPPHPTGVPRHDEIRVIRGDPRVAPLVAAEIPDKRAPSPTRYAADEGLLRSGLVIVVAAGRV